MLIPLSIAARIAPSGSFFLVPPHIHPPIAQAPKPTTEAWIPDFPNGRYFILFLIYLNVLKLRLFGTNQYLLTISAVNRRDMLRKSSSELLVRVSLLCRYL